MEGDAAMGTLCLGLCSKSENHGNDETPGPVAKRMQHLLAAESWEVCDRVIRLVLRAKTQGLAVEYEQLERDLYNWDKSTMRDKIRAEWAKQFYTPGTERAEEENL
jgi:CRISPR system Cascade subunit CasB